MRRFPGADRRSSTGSSRNRYGRSCASRFCSTSSPPREARLRRRSSTRSPSALAPRSSPDRSARLGSKQQRSVDGRRANQPRQASDRFEARIADLPEADQQAFRELLGQPEMLSPVAVSRVRLMVRLGDSYRVKDPDGHAPLSLRALCGRRKAKRGRSGGVGRRHSRRTRRPRPSSSSRRASYSEENGYDYDELNEPRGAHQASVVTVNPYPYWFGYPYWYSDLPISIPTATGIPIRPTSGTTATTVSFVWWGLPVARVHALVLVRSPPPSLQASVALLRSALQPSLLRAHRLPPHRGQLGDVARPGRSPSRRRPRRLGERALGAPGRARWRGTLATRGSNSAFFNRNQGTDRWSGRDGWSRSRGRTSLVDRVAPGLARAVGWWRGAQRTWPRPRFARGCAPTHPRHSPMPTWRPTAPGSRQPRSLGWSDHSARPRR